MLTSGKYIDKQKALTYNGKYTGEGTVVAIIDTGIDYDHKDMRVSDEKTVKLSSQDVKQIVENKKLKGRFYTNKVPYGYN